MKKITITFIGATLLSAASYATPQATVDISLLKSEAMSPSRAKAGFKKSPSG
jgi:hypothetical protein